MVRRFTYYLHSFDVETDDWKTYCDRLDMYFLKHEVANELRLPTLVSVVGDTAYQLLLDVCRPRTPLECAYEEVIKIMGDYLQSKSSFMEERYKFRRHHQRAGQSVGSYVTELQALATFCKFGSALDDNMRDQIVCGIHNEALRQRMFSERSLTFDKAVSIARAVEGTEARFASPALSKPGQEDECGPITSHETDRRNTINLKDRSLKNKREDDNASYRTKMECKSHSVSANDGAKVVVKSLQVKHFKSASASEGMLRRATAAWNHKGILKHTKSNTVVHTSQARSHIM